MNKFNVKEYAELKGITEDAVRKKIKRGSLNAQRDGGRWLIEVDLPANTTRQDTNLANKTEQDRETRQNKTRQGADLANKTEQDRETRQNKTRQGAGLANKTEQDRETRQNKTRQDADLANKTEQDRETRQNKTENLTKQDIENQSAQTRTLVNAHDNRWQHEIQKIHEDHSKEIRELRDEYKDEAKRKMMPFYVVCVIGLVSLGGLLWYFNEQIKSEKSEKSELKKEHSEEVSLIQKEAKTAQNEIQSRLEASRLKSEAFQVKSEASKTALQIKIDQLNEGRVVEAKAKAELSAELKILQADFERQKIEIEKGKAEAEIREVNTK